MKANEIFVGVIGTARDMHINGGEETEISLVNRRGGRSSLFWWDKEGFRWKACPDFDGDMMLVDVVKNIQGFNWI